jgi:predicted PilT family ATPase
MDSQTKSSQVADTVAALKGIPTREDLVKLLNEQLVEVTFTKLDGDERTMMCTLRENFLPQANKGDPLSQTKIRNLEEKNLVVWDINANGWRSFRYDRVKKVAQITPLSD